MGRSVQGTAITRLLIVTNGGDRGVHALLTISVVVQSPTPILSPLLLFHPLFSPISPHPPAPHHPQTQTIREDYDFQKRRLYFC